jgi:hypothetical protein
MASLMPFRPEKERGHEPDSTLTLPHATSARSTIPVVTIAHAADCHATMSPEHCPRQQRHSANQHHQDERQKHAPLTSW